MNSISVHYGLSANLNQSMIWSLLPITQNFLPKNNITRNVMQKFTGTHYTIYARSFYKFSKRRSL